MNFIDLTMILLLVGFLALGFFQGTLRLLVAIVSFYVSIILASLYFQVAAVYFRRQFGTTLDVGQIVAFGLILLVAFLLLSIAGLYTFRYARLPASLDFIDRIIGTLLGLVMGGLIVGMVAEILLLLFVSRSPASSVDYPIVKMFQDGVRGATTIPLFINTVLPLIFSVARPLLPAEAYFIFQAR